MSPAAALLLVVTLGQFFAQLNGQVCPKDLTPLNLTKKTIVASSTCQDTEYCYDNSLTGLKECSNCSERHLVDVSNIVDGNVSTHWISLPGVVAVNVTLDLVQVWLPSCVTICHSANSC